jgi:hypothetical protein
MGLTQSKVIRLETLLELVGGMNLIRCSAGSCEDGYSSVFDYGQLSGEIDTFEANTLRLVPQG